MAYKKFEAERNETHDWEKDKVLEGRFINSRKVNTVNGESWLYTIEKEDGKKVDVWGKTLLDSFFHNIPLGSKVRITYQGKLKSQKGGRSYHAFVMEYDDTGLQ